jgi:hypothetical protein
MVLLIFACCLGVDGLVHTRPTKHFFARSKAAPQMQLPQPWDAPRALRTAFFFNSPAQVLDRLGLGRPKQARPDGLVWSSARSDLATWGQLDDVVSERTVKSRPSIGSVAHIT